MRFNETRYDVLAGWEKLSWLRPRSLQNTHADRFCCLLRPAHFDRGSGGSESRSLLDYFLSAQV